MRNEHLPQAEYSSRERWRKRHHRRIRYLRRRTGALLLLLGLLGGLGYGATSLYRWWQARTPTAAAPSKAPGQSQGQSEARPQGRATLSFAVDFYLQGADLDGDGRAEKVAVGKPESGVRQVTLVRGADGEEQPVGSPLTLPDQPLALQDLPRARQVLVWQGQLPRRSGPVPVKVAGAEAMLAGGGEPDRKAWSLDPTRGLIPVDYYALAAPILPEEPALILVDKGLNVLWYYENGHPVITARVATGKHVSGPAPTAANQKENHITPEGRLPVILRMPGAPHYQTKSPARAPGNPLGTRWLGFAAFPGDNGTIWAIHGTNDPARLGRWVSEGSVEMRNEELEQLYDRVKLGTPIIIQNSVGKQ